VRVWSSGFMGKVSGFGFRVSDLGVWVSNFGFRDSNVFFFFITLKLRVE